ncbi:unnamed protein product [Meloidogyne enterolobii]|uniref:Uncharacterized protein n=1 Tax=Meloidogyne enterolobii TaxID=390850 RepID=A0ACB0YRA4_MELEN
MQSKNIHWRCSNLDCQATAKAEEKNGQFIGSLGEKEHNHPPAIQKKVCEELRNRLKKDKRPILGEVRANIPDEVYIALGSDDALNQLIKRQKKQKFGNVNCVDLGKMVIPAFLTEKYNSSTLIYDSRDERGNEDVVLVFSHARLLDILSQNKHWACDGTFKSAPRPFAQCFCIGAFVRGRIVVCVQALLPTKKTIHYQEVLREVRRAINEAE